ncbi:MAP kinase [Scenedesmus sp. NREL 46B-D3]|nr:MAP kinase [Scenedesmus sp. NREL 46B-D3]
MRHSKSLGSLATWPSRPGRSNSTKSSLADVAESQQAWPTSADAYELLDECGKGVSAEVYRARCLVNNRIVGIKALNLEWLMTPLDEVMHEAQLMKAYKHGSILPLYCSFVTGQELWMVMPYMEGGSVAHILRYKYPEGLSEAVIAAIMRKVLEALAYVHKQGDIHRDVKAGNVLVDGDGNVKLGDFGVAAMHAVVAFE